MCPASSSAMPAQLQCLLLKESGLSHTIQCTPAPQADVRLFQTLIRFDHVYVVRWSASVLHVHSLQNRPDTYGCRHAGMQLTARAAVGRCTSRRTGTSYMRCPTCASTCATCITPQVSAGARDAREPILPATQRPPQRQIVSDEILQPGCQELCITAQALAGQSTCTTSRRTTSHPTQR